MTQYSGPGFSPFSSDGMFRYKITAPIVTPLFNFDANREHIFLSNQDRFSVPGNFDLFKRISSDMARRGGLLEPTAHWHLDNAGRLSNGEANQAAAIVYEISESAFMEKYGTLQQMLDPYVGSHGMTLATVEDIKNYQRYIYAVDHLELVRFNLEGFVTRTNALVTDLGSIIDINLITGYAIPQDDNLITVLEVGGGYGRLAEVFINTLHGRCRYTIADSVPASLMFSYNYLKLALPRHRIGSYYNGDSFADDYDVYIMPTWELGNIDYRWDVVASIEAFQEMSPHHVDYYTHYFEKSLNDGGLAYISGSWQYANREAYQFSPAMKTLWIGNTPRSWTYIHPTHVLRKGQSDYSEINKRMLENFALHCG